MAMKKGTGISPLSILCLLAILWVLPTMDKSNMLNAQRVIAGEAPTSRILFIFDASNSMSGQWEGERKIDIAREILFEMLDTLEQREKLELAHQLAMLKVDVIEAGFPIASPGDFEAVHTFSPEQVEWFKAGSALNIVRQKVAAAN